MGGDPRRTAMTAGVRVAAIAALLLVSFAPAGAKDNKVRLKGDLHVGDRHVAIDDSLTVRRESGGSIDVGPGIHIETDESSIVRMFSDVTVDTLEQVDGSVVALFGDVIVNGRVTEDAVAVLGSVRLAPGAVVEGDAVAIGGALDQPSSAKVNGESVSLTFFPVMPGLPPLRALSLMLLVLWVVAMVLGAVLAIIVPARIHRVAETIAERTGWSLLLGFFLPPLATIAAVLLAITVIGVPIALLLPVMYMLILWAGLIGAGHLIGSRFTGRAVGEGNPFLSVLLGSVVVTVLFGAGAMLAGPPSGLGTLGIVLPALGLLFATALAVVGSGAVLLSGFGSPPRASPAAGTVASAPPAESAASPVTPPATA